MSIDEAERLRICEHVAIDMANAGMGWNYDAIERLTRPEPSALAALRSLQVFERMSEPTPYQRGVLDRYQHRRIRHR